MKKRIKNITKIKYGEQLILRILALVASIVLWLVITNVVNPYYVKTFKDVHIEFENFDEFSKKFSIMNSYEKTCNVTVSGRRNDVIKLREKDIKPFIDFEKVEEGDSSLRVELKNINSRITVKKSEIPKLAVDVEKIVNKTFPVKIHKIGNIAGEYWAEFKPSIAYVNVVGAESEVDSVEEVAAVVDLTNVTDDTKVESLLEIVSKSKIGEKPNVKLTRDKVDIDVLIYTEKDVAIDFNVIGAPKEGLELVEADIYPKTISINGPYKELEKIKSIKAVDFNMSDYGAVGDYSKELNFVTEGNVAISENEKAVLEFSLDKIISKTVNFSTDNIDVKVTPKDKELKRFYPDKLIFNVSGYSRVVEDISEKDIKVSLTVPFDFPGFRPFYYEYDFVDEVKMPKLTIKKLVDKVSVSLKKKTN